MAEGDFIAQVDVGAGVPVDVMMDDPSEGPHTVLVLDVREVKNDQEQGGKTTWRFQVQDTEPGSPTLGVVCQVVIGTDMSKPFNKGHLVNSLHGAGCHPDKIKGVIQLTPDVWRGRPNFIFVKPAAEGELTPQGRPARANKNFITKEMYEAAKKAAALRVTKPSAIGTSTMTQAPAPGGTSLTQNGPSSPPPPEQRAPVSLQNLFS